MPSAPKPSLKQPLSTFSFEAIGTAWTIEFYEPLIDPSDLRVLIDARIEQFDRTYSRFRADSLVSHIAKSVGTYQFPDDADLLFEFYKRLYHATDGLMTPLIGSVMVEAGYDAAYSLQPGQLHQPPAWTEAMVFNNGTLTTNQPILLDFGAAGKGYLIDILGALLKQYGITQYCIDAGGDILSRGNQKLHIGLEHPDNIGQVIGVAELHNSSICGSAGNRRTWAQFHHTINPVTLQSPTHIKALWTTADSAMLADGLATALYFTEPARLKQSFAFEYAIFYEDYSLDHSPGLTAKFFERTA